MLSISKTPMVLRLRSGIGCSGDKMEFVPSVIRSFIDIVRGRDGEPRRSSMTIKPDVSEVWFASPVIGGVWDAIPRRPHNVCSTTSRVHLMGAPVRRRHGL